MNRRQFSLQLVSGVAGAAALSSLGLAPSVALAQGTTPVEGQDFLKLKTPLLQAKTGKVEVVEFFWYGCPHCNHFLPKIEGWAAKVPADVHFRRIPVAFDALKEIHQQIYYTWEALGLVEQMHVKTFARFHIEHKPINRWEDMQQFAQANALDVAKVKAAWDSFGVQTKMKQAKQLSEDYAVDGVPEMGIQGQWTTSPGTAKGEDECLKVTDFLIDRVRKSAH